MKYIDIAQNLTTQWAKLCNTLDFTKSDQNRAYIMPIFCHISVKQRQLPNQQDDSGLGVIQLFENNSGINFSSR